jgi:uncharacterized protein (DUF2252 family)
LNALQVKSTFNSLPEWPRAEKSTQIVYLFNIWPIKITYCFVNSYLLGAVLMVAIRMSNHDFFGTQVRLRHGSCSLRPGSLCLILLSQWLLITLPTFCFADNSDRPSYVISAISKWNAESAVVDRRAKYQKMNASPLAFFRGTNHLFWADISHAKIVQRFGSPTTKTWLHGDLHVENFGTYDNSQQEIVYDFNDFDDSLIADFQYDLMRLATSIILICKTEKLSDLEQSRIIDSLTASYLRTLLTCRDSDVELLTSVDRETAYGRLDEFMKEVAAEESRVEMLKKYTRDVSGARRFLLSADRLYSVDIATRTKIENSVTRYVATTVAKHPREFWMVKDVARRIFMGTGSLGVSRYYVLIEGATKAADDDRILDLKAQKLATGFRFTSQSAADKQLHKQAGRRHQLAYQSLVPRADPLLGWTEIDGQQFSVRERSPYKGTLPIEVLDSVVRVEKLAEQWGKITALRHARGDKDANLELVPYQFEDEVLKSLAGRQREFSSFVYQVATAYARRVARDYAAFQVAIDDGRLK